MISGGAAERREREDEAERDKDESTQPAPDKKEMAPSSALLIMHASDKGVEAPLSLSETRSPSKDKSVSSQREGTKSPKEITTMNSESESIVINPEADKMGETKLSLDKRAQDKNEDEEGNKIPPPTLQKVPSR
jgi:hypothetical protein